MNRIKELRLKHGLKQSDLARLLNVKDAAISKYENEKIPLTADTILILSDIFNVSTDYLLGKSQNALSISEPEWRYPPSSNRLGQILVEYRKDNELTSADFSKKLEISEELEIEFENGTSIPSFDLIKKMSALMDGYTIDYLIGAVDTTHIPSEPIEIDGIKYVSAIAKSSLHFKARLEDICLRKGIHSNNCEEQIGLSKQAFLDIQWNRMPTLSELLRLSYSFGVSIDYLIGKTDIPLEKISNDELELILNYRDCIDIYKENIQKRAYELCLDTLKEKSVAADEPLKKTGTEHMGK